LIVRKITKIVATRCLILAQNAAKCVWWPGSARTRWGSLSAPPDSLASKRGPTSKGREGKRREVKGREGKAFRQINMYHYTTAV